MSKTTPLQEKLRCLIAAEGPISVARFMALCLSDPQHGYYCTRNPLGPGGDFITAPEISQIFGELLGLWAVAVWRQMGAPAHAILVELGPGRGTLMADALRAARVDDEFRTKLSVHLVEMSPVLREQQQTTLASADMPIRWHDNVADLPNAPLILLANEFFDALPIRQAARTPSGWHERMVGFNEREELCLLLHPVPLAVEPIRGASASAPLGAVFEWRSPAEIVELGARIATHGGAALIVDYGHAVSGFGETLQAVRQHRFVDPLDSPGEADLTAHLDFAAIGRTAKRLGLAVHGPMEQGDFLRRLGIEARAARLKTAATPEQIAAIDAALARLTGSGRDEMGTLFKAVALADPSLGPLPAFDL